MEEEGEGEGQGKKERRKVVQKKRGKTFNGKGKIILIY